MIANMPLSGKVIRSCPSLKYIDVAFTGVDHVDLEAAKERKVAVSNASGYSNESVAELSLCMMLSLLRNVKQVEDRCRNEGTKDGLVGRELKGKKQSEILQNQKTDGKKQRGGTRMSVSVGQSGMTWNIFL